MDYEFCDHLFDFVRAPFAASGKPPVARSIEFYWIPSGILGTTQCVYGGTKPGKDFCDWLINHSSKEFTELLPEEALRCEGFDFPPVPNVDDWKATYQFVDGKSLRWLVLDVRLYQPGDRYDGAVRISALPDGQGMATHPLPPLPDPEPIADEPKK